MWVSEWIVFFPLFFPSHLVSFNSLLNFFPSSFGCRVCAFCICPPVDSTHTRSPLYFFCELFVLRSTNVIYRMYVVFATGLLSFSLPRGTHTHTHTYLPYICTDLWKSKKIRRIFPHSFLPLVSPWSSVCVLYVVCAALNTIFPTHTHHTHTVQQLKPSYAHLSNENQRA